VLLYIFIGAIIGGIGGFLLAHLKKGKTPSPPTPEGPESVEQKKPAPRRRLGNLLGTALMGVAVGGFVGYMAYDLKGLAYKRSDQIIEIKSEQQFNDLVANSGKPVLVDFYLPGCVPCAEMAPTISRIADETKGRALVLSVNADTQSALTRRYHANEGVPLFVIIHNGQETARYTGLQDKEVLLNALVGP